MNNHYVPQFIIREFNAKPYFFDMEKGVLLKKQPKKIFYEEDMYSDEVETIANQTVEMPFSLLLKNKLNCEKATLTREEVELVKRYMLLASVRTMGADGFAEKIRGFASNADRYLEPLRETPEGFCMFFKRRVADLRLTNRDLYMLAMTRFCEDKTSKDLLLDSLLPLEMYVWALTFTVSYISIWDAPKGKQFILTDCGMNSEYEGTRQLTGHDISKSSYLLWLAKNGSPSERGAAGLYLAYSQSMYENFNFFPINNHRVIVAINPFFRMYFPDKLVDQEGKQIFEAKPSIWPSSMENVNLFSVPGCTYSIPGQTTPNDLFVYEKQELSPFETDYLNFLMAGHAKGAIAFDNPESVKVSLLAAFWGYTRMKSVTSVGMSDQDELTNLIKNYSESKLKPLIDELCNGQPNDKDMLLAAATFRYLCHLWIEEFNQNPYIAQYLLDNPELLADERAFGFLGTIEQRKAILEERAKVLKPTKA